MGSRHHARFAGYSHGTVYADLPSGIDVKDDGTLWSMDLVSKENISY